MEQTDNFYDPETGMFIINPEIKMAHILGEDVEFLDLSESGFFKKLSKLFKKNN